MGGKCKVSIKDSFIRICSQKTSNKNLYCVHSYKSLGQTLTFAGPNSEWMFARWVSLKPLLATPSTIILYWYTIGLYIKVDKPVVRFQTDARERLLKNTNSAD